MINLLLKRDVVETIIPNAAGAVTRVSTTAGAWSAYGEVISAADMTTLCPNGFILCGAYLYERLYSAVSGAGYSVCTHQIATGEAASEVPIAEDRTVGLLYEMTVGDGMMGYKASTLLFPPTFVPTGTRLAYRVSSNTATVQRGSIYLVGYKAGDWGLPLKYLKDSIAYMKGLEVQAKSAVCYPAQGTTTVATGNPAWADGAEIDFVASATSPTLITSVAAYGGASAVSAHAKICINGVVQSEVGLPCASSQIGAIAQSVLPRPLLVKTGERVSVILHGTIASKNVGISLQGFELK